MNLQDAISRTAGVMAPPSTTGLQLREATVIDVNVATNIYGLQFAGSTSRIYAYGMPGVYVPAGYTCYCLQTTNSLLVIGPAGQAAYSWTPVLTATTTSPTLSTNGTHVQQGSCYFAGGLCTFWGNIQFGTVGAAAGSGTYQVTGLPVLPKALRPSNGAGKARFTRAAPANNSWPEMIIADTGIITFRYPAAYPTGADTVITHAVPWAWAASDRLEFWGSFPFI